MMVQVAARGDDGQEYDKTSRLFSCSLGFASNPMADAARLVHIPTDLPSGRLVENATPIDLNGRLQLIVVTVRPAHKEMGEARHESIGTISEHGNAAPRIVETFRDFDPAGSGYIGTSHLLSVLDELAPGVGR